MYYVMFEYAVRSVACRLDGYRMLALDGISIDMCGVPAVLWILFFHTYHMGMELDMHIICTHTCTYNVKVVTLLLYVYSCMCICM